jgi:hypothetical protein
MKSPLACRFCGEPSWTGDEIGPAHSCCVFWMGQMGRNYCVACRESRMLARKRRPRTSYRDFRGSKQRAWTEDFR